jgi:23S rRNA (guanosine2251-2'-O)-methyltransferase
MLTVYGRKPVREALDNPRLECGTLHLASSNRPGGIILELLQRARERGIPVREHSREALARISRNGRQDQGVALDILCPHFAELDDYLVRLDGLDGPTRLLALDGVSNPQNFGMVVRTARAAGAAGLLHADRGNPALGPLLIKASAGTVFEAPLLRCEALPAAVRACRDAGFTVYTLRADAPESLFSAQLAPRSLFVLGSESEGISDAVEQMADSALHIPMAAGVESLNVAVSAALVLYAGALNGTGRPSPPPGP